MKWRSYYYAYTSQYFEDSGSFKGFDYTPKDERKLSENLYFKLMDIFLDEEKTKAKFNYDVNKLILKYYGSTSTEELAIRTNSNVWKKLAADFNVNTKYVKIESGKKEKILPLQEELEKGNAVLLSVFSNGSGKGHIVRLQEINDEGIIVDDPYGDVSERLELRENKKSGYYKNGLKDQRNHHSKKLNQPKMGEDNLWKWENLEKTIIKYAHIYSKQEKK
ncbi:hypothetical protein [Flammeovirga aprica]|uniref:Peptidase C39-like domain-containing protein n=1 Tax=Flammeovirga aprica JL-4 TaxID=694437 RepID=A0A7X9P102_9BACT|nr:hypothetical protein [Flammeovirga aprica]NME67450.1 hypothetical protein [Flammeovirga aprica JL-4]